MKRIFTALLVLSLSGHVFADRSTGDGSPYPQNNNSSGSNNSATNTTSQDNQQLLQEMNKKTSQGLKVFDKLMKDDQSKEDFFADLGKNPTADQFEGGDGNGASVENPFAKILGNDVEGRQ